MGCFFWKGSGQMDKFPLYRNGKPAGELTTETQTMYTYFEASCRLPKNELCCVWAVGDTGELRIGILEPVGERSVIRRRFSQQMTAPLGKILRGEVRSVAQRTEQAIWQSVRTGTQLFRTPWLREPLRTAEGVMTRMEGGCRHVALPYDSQNPFPLTGVFCFARLISIEGKDYLQFAFDQNERPVFR